MIAPLLMSLLVLAAAAALVLGRRAVRYWRNERAGRPYELAEDRAGTVARAAAAGGAVLVAAALAGTLVSGAGTGDDGGAKAGPAAATAAPAESRTGTPVPPPPPPRTPEPAPPPPRVRTLGHLAGGTMDLLPDGTRVWLPPWYDSPRAAGVAYPVVLARVTAPADGDLYAGLALGVERRVADAFIVVAPPDCARPAGPVLAEVARRYRTLTAPTARAALGVGPGAACAVRDAFADSAGWAAAVGVSGTYPSAAPAPAPGPRLPVLLALPAGEPDTTGSSARALRTALHRHGTEVRLLDGVAQRRELFVRIAGFLTEKLDGPARGAGTGPVPTASSVPTTEPVPTTAPVPRTRPTDVPQPQPTVPASPHVLAVTPKPTVTREGATVVP
ncbi:hypothetical protein [Actinacidiphila acididurans]|uniref:Uncharacterized protein n=1 Tax=Actinacidiphila acididurans TaxID=2784346 RepID=A0ABS2TPQ0_9ACTN|nr:hypothetical protein [Actinacidiphila acididurans]MBM9505319.1 hypothetical protein [Actinacidiphila acididurans]